MPRLLRSWLLGLVLIIPLGSAAAQAGPSSLDSASLAQLRPSRFVRVQFPDLSRTQGRVVRGSATEVYLNQDGQERQIPTAEIQRAWVRGRATGLGAIVGGVLGLGSGLFFGALVDGLCEYDCAGDATLTLGVLGAAGGAGAGAIIGSLFPRWHEVK